ncbi:MAG: hypothetical protein Q8P12_01420 [bacterium]|nr:hypothetical protein [bacterium]
MIKILRALALLLKNPLYLLGALVLAVLLFFIYFLINDWALYRSAFSISPNLLFLAEVFVYHIRTVSFAVGWLNVAAVGVVAVLGGINLSLTAFRVRRTGVLVGRTGALSALGSLTGAFAASCSACSTALISVLGISGGLAIFPFGGLEISILAMVILLAALYYIAKSLGEFGLLGE